MRRRLTVLSLGLGLLAVAAWPGASLANVKRTVMSVDIPNNTTSNVAQVRFLLVSPGIGTLLQAELAKPQPGTPVAVGPANRFIPTVSFVGANVVQVNIDAVRVIRPGEKLQFTVSVQGARQIGISFSSPAPRFTGGWFSTVGGQNPLTPAPRLPGFAVVTNDLGYLVLNNLDEPFGVRNLEFLADITLAAFEAIDLEAVLAEALDGSLPNFFLSAPGSREFLGLPDPDIDHLFAAVGQILDSSGSVVGAFAHGVEVGVPWAGTWVLVVFGVGAAAGARAGGRRPRSSRPARRWA